MSHFRRRSLAKRLRLRRLPRRGARGEWGGVVRVVRVAGLGRGQGEGGRTGGARSAAEKRCVVVGFHGLGVHVRCGHLLLPRVVLIADSSPG